MIGYPYHYGPEDLDKNESSIIFYLNPVVEPIKLASTLTVLTDFENLGIGDEFAFEFCDQISKVCKTFYRVPTTNTLVLDYQGFCNLITESETIVDGISNKLLIPKELVLLKANNFLIEENVIVQANGIQGAVYKIGSTLQSGGSALLVTRTLAMAKIVGGNGLQLLRSQPALAIALPTTGAIFFYGCGAIVGDNVVGKILVTTGDVLALPMKGCELTWNVYITPLTQRLFGMPVILNMTQTFKTGVGYTLQEAISSYSNKTSVAEFVKAKTSQLLVKLADWIKP